MDSFYGGLKGKDFSISYYDPERREYFRSKNKHPDGKGLMDDLAKKWQSPIGVGDYVIVSYGLTSDAEYSRHAKVDLESADEKSYNSTIWEKIYTEENITAKDIFFLDGAKKGLGYKLVTSMTGNTPVLTVENGNPPEAPGADPWLEYDNTNVDAPKLTLHMPTTQIFKDEHVDDTHHKNVGDTPEVEINSTGNNADSTDRAYEPELIFKLPVSQRILFKPQEEGDVGSEPEVLWEDTVPTTQPGDIVTEGTVNRPTLKFKMPKTQIFEASQIKVQYTDNVNSPSVQMVTSGTWAADGTVFSPQRPGLIFTLPLAQTINYQGFVLKDANFGQAAGEKLVEWDDTNDPGMDGNKSDLINSPTLKFNLPRAQVMDQPTQEAKGPAYSPTVTDIGTVNRPKLKFFLPRSAKLVAIDDATQKSKTYFTENYAGTVYANMDVGDYLINAATGFLYKADQKDDTTIRFAFQARFSIYIPDVTSDYDTPYFLGTGGTYERREIGVTKTFTDTEQTKMEFKFTIPRQPAIEVQVQEVAPLDSAAAALAQIKDAATLLYKLNVHRGSKILATNSSLAGNGDMYIDPTNGDWYLQESNAWTKKGSLRGPEGKALKIIASFEYDNITNGGSDTVANVGRLLEQEPSLNIVPTDADTYPKRDELIKVLWKQRYTGTGSVESETAYWYFNLNGTNAGWDRVQLTAGMGDIIMNAYSPSNEDNKTYSIQYINKLIRNTPTTDLERATLTDLDKKTYSIQQLDKFTMWENIGAGTVTRVSFKKGSDLPLTTDEGGIYLVSARDGGQILGDNLFVNIGGGEIVQISAARLSQRVADGAGGYTYVVVEPEDIVTKSGITGLADNAILAGNATGGVRAISNGAGAFYSDGLVSPKFGKLPIEAGGTNAITESEARDNLKVYSKTEVDDNATTQTFDNLTIPLAGWTLNTATNLYENTVAVLGLTCGKDGKTPPIVVCTSNDTDYQELLGAAAEDDQIVFTIERVPAADIGILVIDMK